MLQIILDLLDKLSIIFHIRRLTFKDRVANNFHVLKWRLIKLFTPFKMENWSEKEKGGYELVFEDNFKEVNWDEFGYDKWKIGEGWGMYHPEKPNVYYGAPEIDEESGYTKFTCKYNPKEFPTEDGGTILIPYEVSLLSSDRWFRQKYGRFECRMTIPDAPSAFPAFWVWGGDPYAEIDMYEGKGRKSGKTVVYQDMNLHWVEEDGDWNHLRTSSVKLDSVWNFQNKFHEFVLEWTLDKIEIYTDGYKVFQYTKKDVLDKRYAIPLWVIINNSIHPTYTKHTPDYYSEFLVDYIRVYKHK